MNSADPPKLFSRFFKWYCREWLYETIMGDLQEQFAEDLRLRGHLKAKGRFAWNVIRFFRPGIVKKGNSELNQTAMLKNYLKISLRNMRRHQTFSFINISGLAVGIACCILITLYVRHELSYDKYHANYDRMYRIVQSFRSNAEAEANPEPSLEDFQVWGNGPVGPALANDFPEVDQICRFKSTGSFLLEVNGKRFQEDNVWFADSTALEMFSWDMVAGDPKTALLDPESIVLTETLARKYFDNQNPIGEFIQLDGYGQLKVTGIIKDIPNNSHFHFDGLRPLTASYHWNREVFNWWGYVDFYTYFTLKDRTSIASIEAKTGPFIEKYVDDWQGYDIKFEPLSDAYLYSKAGRQPGTVGSLSNIYILISIAVFILFIACINFMNLSTARSVERAKEVGIRKAIGSQKASLVRQFLVESVFMVLLASVVAIVLTAFAIPVLESVTDKVFDLKTVINPTSLTLVISGLLLVGLLSGFYPAYVLSRFKPVEVLKGSLKGTAHGNILRQILVILQFSLSIILLVGTMVIYKQMAYMKNYQKGYSSEQTMILDFHWDSRVQRQIRPIKEAISQHRNVLSVSAQRAVPGDFFPNAGTQIETPSGEMVNHGPALFEVDEDFVPTFEMELVAGRHFSKDFPLDSAEALMVNEAAARLWGYANPSDIVGKRFDQWGRQGKVIGVIKDFHYVSLHKPVEPLALRYAVPGNTAKLAIKVSSQNMTETVQELEDLWYDLAPHRPFLVHFVDEAFNEQYQKDEKFASVFSAFSGIAIFIACLGLFGLTIYSTAQRTKEIGIRKVLGASVPKIMLLISMDFAKLFFIAMILAIPVSIYAMNSWLEDFAYSISLSWDIFIGAGLTTLIVSVLTMSTKTIKAATANPVRALRAE